MYLQLQVCGIVQGVSGGIWSVTGGICQMYSPAFVWDDVTTIVYIYKTVMVDLDYAYLA